ncbi:hypothetical protein MKX01_031444 [Papaver californicum]|nr:hypothetical protein MKX01_031444 [Papaver californicum]
MIFTRASRYVSKPVSCVSTLFAIPRLSKRFLITFPYALPLMIGAYLANYAHLYLINAIPKMNDVIDIIFVIIYGSVVSGVDAYIIALWNLANVISVLEPNIHGSTAMKRSRQLLRGKTSIAFLLVVLYLIAAPAILSIENLVMFMNYDNHIIVRILLLAFCVIIMTGVNFVGLIGQSVLYYACKGFHNEVIDKEVLYAHLDGKESGNNNSVESDNMEV